MKKNLPSILVLLFFSVAAFSMTLSPKVTKPPQGREFKTGTSKRSLAADLEDDGAKLIQSLVGCANSSKDTPSARLCAEGFFSVSLKPSEKDQLLAWFILPFELSYPETCQTSAIELLPAEEVQKADLFLCSSYAKSGLQKLAVFLLHKDSEGLRLVNIKR